MEKKKKIKFASVMVERNSLDACKALAKRLGYPSSLVFYICLLEGCNNVKNWTHEQMSDYLDVLYRQGENVEAFV